MLPDWQHFLFPVNKTSFCGKMGVKLSCSVIFDPKLMKKDKITCVHK